MSSKSVMGKYLIHYRDRSINDPLLKNLTKAHIRYLEGRIIDIAKLPELSVHFIRKWASTGQNVLTSK